MAGSVQPIFVVGCGRSGTQSLARMLSSLDDVTMHHEYMIHHVQPLGAKYHHGLVDRHQVQEVISQLHGAALSFSSTAIWGDCSNKLAWFIDVLAEMFPAARFVHIVRDGRKVVSSLFHKLGDECLDDRSNAAFRAWVAEPETAPMPPPEKKYWWPEAREGDPEKAEYPDFDHFERIAFHWAQINREINRQLAAVSPDRWLRLKLEDIVSDRKSLQALVRFVGAEAAETQYQLMAKPHNVIKPVNYRMTDQQMTSFWRLAGAEMERLGYTDRQEYDLAYDNAPSKGNDHNAHS